LTLEEPVSTTHHGNTVYKRFRLEPGSRDAAAAQHSEGLMRCSADLGGYIHSEPGKDEVPIGSRYLLRDPKFGSCAGRNFSPKEYAATAQMIIAKASMEFLPE
jgi:hypothetical protein